MSEAYGWGAFEHAQQVISACVAAGRPFYQEMQGLSAGHDNDFSELYARGARQLTAFVQAGQAGWLAGSLLPAALLQANKRTSRILRTALDSLYSASFSSRVLRRVSKLGTLL